MGYSVECLRTTSSISRASHHKTPLVLMFSLACSAQVAISQSHRYLFFFFRLQTRKTTSIFTATFRRLVYRISIVYAQSLSLRSEELDADTVYSFVPNIGDSDPSSRCTYSKITNDADVDLNHSF